MVKEIRNLSFFQSIITNEIMLLSSALYGKNDVENDTKSNLKIALPFPFLIYEENFLICRIRRCVFERKNSEIPVE